MNFCYNKSILRHAYVAWPPTPQTAIHCVVSCSPSNILVNATVAIIKVNFIGKSNGIYVLGREKVKWLVAMLKWVLGWELWAGSWSLEWREKKWGVTRYYSFLLVNFLWLFDSLMGSLMMRQQYLWMFAMTCLVNLSTVFGLYGTFGYCWLLVSHSGVPNVMASLPIYTFQHEQGILYISISYDRSCWY